MKAMLLLPYREEMGLLDIAKLYLERVFPLVELPEQVISNRDIRYTLRIFKELYTLLKVKQNILSAYHLQMDGQSKKTN